MRSSNYSVPPRKETPITFFLCLPLSVFQFPTFLLFHHFKFPSQEIPHFIQELELFFPRKDNCVLPNLLMKFIENNFNRRLVIIKYFLKGCAMCGEG